MININCSLVVFELTTSRPFSHSVTRAAGIPLTMHNPSLKCPAKTKIQTTATSISQTWECTPLESCDLHERQFDTENATHVRPKWNFADCLIIFKVMEEGKRI